MSDRLYPLELTWDEIDVAMTCMRRSIYRWEDEATRRAEPWFTAEIDQESAQMWEVVHKLGDARRRVHGEPLFEADPR